MYGSNIRDLHYMFSSRCWSAPQVHVVNQASTFVQRAFCWRITGSSTVDQFEFQKAKCSIYLYYRCLSYSKCNGGPCGSTLAQRCNMTEHRQIQSSCHQALGSQLHHASIGNSNPHRFYYEQ